MTHDEMAQAATDLNQTFAGRTVVLLTDDPTDVGFYGDEGMKADVLSISISRDKDGPPYLEVRLNFAPHAEFNLTKEKAVWFGRGDKRDQTVTATEAGQVKDTIEIGLSVEEFHNYLGMAEPNPVYEAWRTTAPETPYVQWLEGMVSAHLALTPEDEDPRP